MLFCFEDRMTNVVKHESVTQKHLWMWNLHPIRLSSVDGMFFSFSWITVQHTKDKLKEGKMKEMKHESHKSQFKSCRVCLSVCLSSVSVSVFRISQKRADQFPYETFRGS